MEPAFDAVENGKNVTKKHDKHFAKLEKLLCEMGKGIGDKSLKIEKDVSIKEALTMAGWEPNGDRVAELAEHLCFENICGETVEKLSTFMSLEDPNCDDFGDANLFVSD